MITIVNMYLPGSAEYIGRPSPLGNPFIIGRHGTRAEVIALYRDWLYQRLTQHDARVCAEIDRLFEIARRGDLNLRCHCAPLPCHGDEIKRHLEGRIAYLGKND